MAKRVWVDNKGWAEGLPSEAPDTGLAYPRGNAALPTVQGINTKEAARVSKPGQRMSSPPKKKIEMAPASGSYKSGSNHVPNSAPIGGSTHLSGSAKYGGSMHPGGKPKMGGSETMSSDGGIGTNSGLAPYRKQASGKNQSMVPGSVHPTGNSGGSGTLPPKMEKS